MGQFENYLHEKKALEFDARQKTDQELQEEQRDFAFYQAPDMYQEQKEKGLGPGAESEALTVGEVNEKDPVAYMQIMYQTLRIDNLKDFEPIVNDIYENDKVVKARWDAAKFITSYMRTEMAAKYCINDQTGMIRDNQKKKDKETLEDEKQELKSDFEFHLKEYTACYNRIGEREKQRESFEQKAAKTESYEEIKAQADSFGNTGYDETSYEKTKEIKKAMRMIVCPQYTAAYDDIHKKLGPRYEISRLCSSVLRKVEFDENWAPVSKEDMRNHEWNMKYLNHLHTYYLGPELEVVKQERLQNEDEMAKEKEEGWEGSVHQAEEEL